MPSPSRPLPRIVICPLRLSICTSAISCMAPLLFAMDAERFSNSAPQPASIASALFKSTLLKISFSTFVFFSWLMLCIAASSFLKVSFRGFRFPPASNADTPRLFSVAAALSVGADKDKIMFLRAVPPSAPLIPRFARTPRAVFSSTVPPARFFAVPPTVRIASPSCATL